ncbi:MAG: AmmeMemoRadiSam system protein B [Treponema sp.]|jgi:AmmeMemoRadiSam system protein B|nr:AmmeMemoRadiSam system protein B [Treponema sp.]
MEAVLAQRERIRCPVVAGMFYPDEKPETLEYIRAFGLERNKGGYARAIIAPHGAWGFSGALVSDAFSAAAGRNGDVSRVIIMGPIHDKREKGLFLSNSHSFHTPLGNIPVDEEITEELEFYGNYFEINDIPHLGEHSIEIILPFVKYCFPGASIVPILMGQPRAEYISDLAQALKTVITPVLNETLFVVSCNLSSDNDEVRAKYLARECLRLFSEKDPSALACAILDGRINACGGALVASLFESGLLDGMYSHFSTENMVSAVGVENNTVFYGAVSFE